MVIFLRFLKKKFKVIKLNVLIFPAAALILSTVLISPLIASAPADPYPELYASKPVSSGEKCEPEKAVYITFDDGPSAVTDDILDILSEEKVKATFFVIGPGGENTDRRLLRIHEEGHAIGIHSWSHEYSKIYSSVDAFLEDFNEDREWVHSVTGEYCDIFRFPGGSKNDFNAQTRDAIIEEMTRRGFRFFEAFSYVNTPSNLAKLYPAKSCYVVFSKEYFYRFEEICSLTGCVNYNELKQERKEQAKMDKAERKRIRKEERARMKEERRASRG